MKKVVEIDNTILEQLELLARDHKIPLRQLAAEAFADMLKKHGRPTNLIEALKLSLRRFPLNDNDTQTPGRKRSR